MDFSTDTVYHMECLNKHTHGRRETLSLSVCTCMSDSYTLNLETIDCTHTFIYLYVYQIRSVKVTLLVSKTSTTEVAFKDFSALPVE